MSEFPSGLLEWSGHRAGGVRRMFHGASGRPSGEVIQTPLLGRLREWSRAVASELPNTPRVVLLVGGPGNGKTEAIEQTILELERALDIGSELSDTLTPRFNPADGTLVPRIVSVQLPEVARRASKTLSIVQDASVSDVLNGGGKPAPALMRDLVRATSNENEVYLACVNRGVLDEALILANETNSEAQLLLSSIVKAASASPNAPSCWPLEGHPSVAIWPMDAESLVLQGHDETTPRPPAAQILALATDADRWPATGCAAGSLCPFCKSRELLSKEPNRSSLLRVLRWFELATGQKWNFRDVFSLTSFLLAGTADHGAIEVSTPCDWAARLIEMDSRNSGRPESVRLAAPFLLVAAQYQHALFGSWPTFGRRGIRQALRELRLENDRTLLGLHYFLTTSRASSIPETVRSQLVTLCDVLDPALADPDLDVDVSSRTQIKLREIDARFSRSIRDGLQFVRRFQFLSAIEVELLARLADADELLAKPEVRSQRPATAAKLQSLIRDFCCRLVRRSVGVRSAVVRDVEVLEAFDSVIAGDENLIHASMKQVEQLLNVDDRFAVTLNTTFGEPPPPESRRLVLTTAKQKVRPAPPNPAIRPRSDLRFLIIGSQGSQQYIPLTYELFRSVRELRNGLLAASLPRTVMALLDTTRARLAGRIVRDEEQLDGAEIHIGIRDEMIVREFGRFVVRGEAQ